MLMKKLGAFILGLMILSGTAKAQTVQDIEKVETYLNSIRSLEARFVQTTSNGGASEGKFYVKKPRQIRMEYNEPVSILIVGDGNYVVYNDKELDQVTHIDYEDIPATIILAEDIKIDGKKIRVVDFYKDAGSTSVTIKHQNSDVSPITLVFSNDPFELKQWKIIDPQSVEITVSLYDTKVDGDLSKDLFKFKNKKSNPLNYRGR